MEKLTSSDVFLGIFNNFPKGKKDFRYEHDEVMDFFCQRREDYSILSDFTREDIYNGLQNLSEARMLRWWSSTPHIRELDSGAINSAFTHFEKSKLFGKEGLEELAKLSREFLERFA